MPPTRRQHLPAHRWWPPLWPARSGQRRANRLRQPSACATVLLNSRAHRDLPAIHRQSSVIRLSVLGSAQRWGRPLSSLVLVGAAVHGQGGRGSVVEVNSECGGGVGGVPVSSLWAVQVKLPISGSAWTTVR